LGVVYLVLLISDPEKFGVIEFDDNDNIIGIEEKPTQPQK